MNTSQKNFMVPLAFVGMMFFAIGFALGINSFLMPVLERSMEMSASESNLLLAATFVPFLIFGIPATKCIEAIGYKKTMALSFIIFAIAFGLFIQAAATESIVWFLFASFICGAANAVLQASVNPYVTILGPIESAAKRISIMGICNKLAWPATTLFITLVIGKTIDQIKMEDLFQPFGIIVGIFVVLDKDNIKGTPIMSEDKPWMKFLKDLPKNFGDTTKWVRPNFVRLTPYTPYTTWHEDPVNDPIFLKRKDSLTISWKLNIKLIPGLRNGYVILPAGMDQTVTPSNNPLIGGLDADKFLYESLTKRGRAIRRNRNRAKGWKIYQSYVPTRQDSILFPRISKVSEQDSLPKQDTLLIKKDSAIINQNSLLLKDKINGKDQTEKSR